MEKQISPKSNSLLFSIIILLTIGIVFISVSTITEAAYTIGDKFFFIKKQLIWTVLGIFSFYIGLKMNTEYLKKFAFPIFILSNILLAIILIPKFGNQALGARRWLDLGFVGIQPSEILKLASVIFFSKIFSQIESKNIKSLIGYLAIPLLLVVLEPNLSTAILVCAIVIIMYYVSGGEIIQLFLLCSAGVVISAGLIFTSPYRLARLSTSYHSNQMILAITSGHIIGKGFANSDQKYRYLPKISTDSILAVIGEETGFIGLISIIYVYYFLITTIFKTSVLSKDIFGSLFCIGIASWIGLQSLINISAVVSLIPLTGVPLPLISYGGSSLVTLMFSLGIVQKIQNQNLKLIYSTNREDKQNNSHHRHTSHTSN